MMSSSRTTIDPELDDEGVPLITKKYLVDLCDSLGLYSTPSVNDKLYVHHKGFAKIQNLDDYVNVHILYLDHNFLTKIENLHNLKKLKCLFLQNNNIEKIENLEELKELTILNLSHNRLKKIENLGELPNLQNLNVSYNYLLDSDSIRGIVECQSLTNIDLSNNDTQYSDDILFIFAQMTNLSCLYLKDNTLKREFLNYRKMMVSHLANLKYLDERPVVEEERRLAEAWRDRGQEGERAEREKMEDERKERERQYKLDNKERDERARHRKKLELERIEREALAEREELFKKKAELLSKKPENWESRLKMIEFNIEKVNKQLDIDPKNPNNRRKEITAGSQNEIDQQTAKEGDENKLAKDSAEQTTNELEELE